MFDVLKNFFFRYWLYLIVLSVGLVGIISVVQSGGQQSIGSGGVLAYLIVGFSIIADKIGLSSSVQQLILFASVIGFLIYFGILFVRQPRPYYKFLGGLVLFAVLLIVLQKMWRQ